MYISIITPCPCLSAPGVCSTAKNVLQGEITPFENHQFFSLISFFPFYLKMCQRCLLLALSVRGREEEKVEGLLWSGGKKVFCGPVVVEGNASGLPRSFCVKNKQFLY